MYEHRRTFRCPACREVISEGVSECRFCGAPVDARAAEAAAAAQARVNQACSDASYLKIVAFVMWGFLLSRFHPFFNWGFVILFFITAFLLARWQRNFGRVETDDLDYWHARRDRNLAALLCLAALPTAAAMWRVGLLLFVPSGIQ